ncbi:MAG: Flp pilus assembly complex ATPase component TadA [Planctomycetes bacterium]|nr:Flp pilus assembly complex ATPase component TadA [Planctomycetota bacterium]
MPPRGDFTDILVKKKLLDAKQIAEAEAASRSQDIPIADAIIKLSLCAAEDVARALAQDAGMKFIDLGELGTPAEIIRLMPESLAREYTIVCIAADGDRMTVAVSDPSNLDMQDKLRFVLNKRIDLVVAAKDALQSVIAKSYGGDEAGGEDMFTEFSEEDMAKAGKGDDSMDESSAPIIRLVQLMITEAVNMRASDIHVEPFEDRMRVRYRIDGVMVERDAVPKRLQGPVISRIKILAKIDIAERRRAQDGRIKVTVGDKEFDLRVSVLPTNHGQSIVMRILDKGNIKIGLRQLGMADENFRQFSGLVRRPNGIILVTGPTGSGKTTTLYAALNELNRPDRKIITAEDPVEYYLPGINQVEVKHSIGLDFARIIRAMLRQAPNIILVGEMRDSETAEMGIQASLTGHLVFSTLHTNDAPGAITRLVDMGVPSYLVASTVIAILAQRLVRLNCPKCKQPHRPTDAVLEAAGISPEVAAKATFMKGKGCGNCNRTGMRGRQGIYELMMMTPRVRELAFKNASSIELRKVALAQGMNSLYMDGVAKAMRGMTTLEEVFRVAKRSEDD